MDAINNMVKTGKEIKKMDEFNRQVASRQVKLLRRELFWIENDILEGNLKTGMDDLKEIIKELNNVITDYNVLYDEGE